MAAKKLRRLDPLRGLDYKGSKTGAWVNKDGVQVKHSYTEDSPLTPMKSTGDTAEVRAMGEKHGRASDRNFANAAKAKRMRRQIGR